MNFFICGVNHKTASVAFRERLAYAQDALEQPLQNAICQEQIHEAAILSTCNRSELYCIADDPHSPMSWLQNYHGLTSEEVEQHVYTYQGQQAVEHIIKVSSGIDSMVLGEPQIFGQLKEAFKMANTFGSIGSQLSQLSQFVFSTTKKIRTETAVGQQPVSIASAAVNLASCIFSDLSQLQVLLIGAGDTSELAARHFQENGVRKIIAANRTLANAEVLANRFSGEGITIDDVQSKLADVDIVLTATASKEAILTKSMVEKAIKTGRRRPMFVVDVAVPRDVDESVGNIDGVYLYNIDDLKQITQEGLEQRKKSADQAMKTISAEATRYYRKLDERSNIDTIRVYRQKVDQVREKELAKALQALRSGQSAEDVLFTMARSLSNKLMHHPSVLLRSASADNNKDFLAVAKRIFELEE